jgi:hypothetical protein
MADGIGIATRLVATGLAQPVFVATAPGQDGFLFAAERGGTIRVVNEASGQVRAQPLLDLTGQVSTDGERGLLGLAFDPDFARDGRFFVDFTDTAGNTQLRSYHVTAGTLVADPASAETIISIPQPPGLSNHKAGWIGFGPDGVLYVATGDGGGAGDPSGNGQNLHSLLGKILRLDVNHDGFPADPARNYAIPADNPFVGQDARPEIWALGLRNPFRDSFDPATGKLYIADVGQDRWEEVDAGRAGGNYGWNVTEGPDAFAGGSLSGGAAVAPLFAYGHTPGAGNAIIGGIVYHGPGTALQGDYVFADEGTGQLFSLSQAGGQVAVTDRTAELAPIPGHPLAHPVAFAADAHGALLMVELGGDIVQLTPHAGILG